MSHAIERMRQERFKAFIEHPPAHRRSEPTWPKPAGTVGC